MRYHDALKKQQTIDERVIRMDGHAKSEKLYVDQFQPYPLPHCTTRDDLAPLFTAKAFVNNDIKTINMESYLGKWLILFFYPSNFTFV